MYMFAYVCLSAYVHIMCAQFHEGQKLLLDS